MRLHRRATVLIVSLFVLTIDLAGCSLIVQGTRESIDVRSIPPGVLAKSGDRQTLTPGELKLKRNKEHKSNVVFGGLVGLIVDLATGAGFRLDPTNVEMDMATGSVKEF